MQTLTATLTQAQKLMGNVLCKVVLSQQGGAGSYTYGVDTTNKILSLTRNRSEWSQTVQILIDNRDNNLTTLNLEGYLGVISYGYNTSSGDEYQAQAPMTLIAQKNDTIFRPNGDLLTTLSLAGLFNLWGEQEATEAYVPDRINTDTVKTILDAIAGATLTCFNTYPSHTITYDSGYDDSIINAYKPAEYFSIGKGESRLSAFRKAMSYLKDKARIENDAGTATIHIFLPTTTGATYDYEYNDALDSSNHNFFIKSVRERLVIPNKVVVMNDPAHDNSYTGNDTDATSYAALNNEYITKTIYVNAASNAECTRLAEARMERYQLAAEKGHGLAPMNVGQELFDYIKITDSAANDTRVGNIGSITENYRPGTFEFEFRFGSLLMTGLAGTLPPIATTTEGGVSGLRSQINSIINYLEGLNDNQQMIISLVEALFDRTKFTHLSVIERFQGPMGADKTD